MDKPKKRIGRPTKPPNPGERVTLGLRVTAELKNRIEAAANEKGRSLSQEAEFRLERSLDREELLPEVLTLAYGKPVADVLIEMRPQLMKLDARRLKGMIDPDMVAKLYEQWKGILGDSADAPVTSQPLTYKQLREFAAKHFFNVVFVEEEGPPVGAPLQKGPRWPGSKEHRAKR